MCEGERGSSVLVTEFLIRKAHLEKFAEVDSGREGGTEKEERENVNKKM